MNDETHDSYIGYETLVKETHKSNATVFRIPHDLRQMGYVSVKHRIYSIHVYSLVIPSHLVKPPSPSVARHQSVRGKKTVRTGVETNKKPNIRNKNKKRFASTLSIDPNAPIDDYYG